MKKGLRAVWMDINRRIHSVEDIEKYVDWCGRNGITVSFPCVNHVVGAVTYPSDVAARLAAYEDWDPMPDLTRLSREAGLETHVWVCIAHGGPVNMGQPGALEISANGPKPKAQANPELFNVDHEGRSMIDVPNQGGGQNPHAFFNLCRPGSRDYLADLCCEVMDRYDVDGIHLDYIRFCFDTGERIEGGKEAYNPKEGEPLVRLEGSRRYSFDEPTLRDFQEETAMDFFGAGNDLTERVAWLYSDVERRESWYAWKSSKVTEMVRRMHEETAKRGKKLSAAVFGGYPWCGQEVGQRWPGWIDEKLLDFVVPMDYDREPDALAGLLADQFSHLAVVPKPAVPFIAGISSSTFRDLEPGARREKLAEYEDTAGKAGQNGISFYCYGSFETLLG